MSFLFATSFYSLTILLFSISHCLPIERTEGPSTGWGYGSHIGFGGSKAAAPTFGALCNRFSFPQSHKLICLLCKGLLDLSCLLPATTSPPPSTTPLTTTVSTTTTPSTTTVSTTTTPSTTTVSTTTTPTTTTTTSTTSTTTPAGGEE